MEDEQQSTLKKKIQILFQLGKWTDVVKLCDSYGEKYGKEEEIELIRYKSQRHMGIPAPTAKPGIEERTAIPQNKVQAHDPAAEHTLVSDPSIPLIPPVKADELPLIREEKFAYDSSPEADDLDVGAPFAEDELVITDPFADDQSEFSLAPEPPPVSIGEPGTTPDDIVFGADELAPDPQAPAPSHQQEEDGEPDFTNLGSMTIDAEPDLGPSAPEEKPRPEFRPEPQATMFSPEKDKTLDDLSRSIGSRDDLNEEPRAARMAAYVNPEEGEKARRPPGPLPESPGQKAPGRKKAAGSKLVLLVVLPLVAALALWLALSGKLDFSGSEEPAAAPQPSATPPAVKRTRPARPATPPALSPQAIEQEKTFAEKFLLAEELNRKGDLIKAWAVLLEAKSIKVTEPLRLLEEQLAQKMREAEAQARKETETIQNTWEMENQEFTEAEKAGTIAAWRAFVARYPGGELALRADKKIAALEKKVQENSQQLLLARIQQSQKVRLRAAYMNLSQADIAAVPRSGGRVPAQLEAHEHGGEKVMLDFATGLMWTLWKKPMAYDKARWWANRVTAGYGNWRLPTTEEALSLLQMDRGLYAGLADLVVWTGDPVSDQTRTVWALRLPAGQFVAAAHNQMHYVWAVRKAGK
jgi:hypothetical protein